MFPSSFTYYFHLAYFCSHLLLAIEYKNILDQNIDRSNWKNTHSFQYKVRKYQIIFTKPNLQCTYHCILLAHVLKHYMNNTLIQAFCFFFMSLTTVCINIRCIKLRNLLRMYEEERRKYHCTKRIDFFSWYINVLGTPKF